MKWEQGARSREERASKMPPTYKDGRTAHAAALYPPLRKRMIENGDWDRWVLVLD